VEQEIAVFKSGGTIKPYIRDMELHLTREKIIDINN
jgi:hypothetical protein